MAFNDKDFGENIEFSVKKKFGIISLNRLHRSNAFTIEFLKDLEIVIQFCQSNHKIKGLILTNEGNSFSTGMDIGAIASYNYEQVKELERTAANICKLLYNGKPAICAINGRTLGEGVVFLVCCDYRIATKESFFQMPEINTAIFPGTGCIILFSKVIGIPWTKKMLMFAEKVPSSKALEIGLIDCIVETQEELMSKAIEKAVFLHPKNQTVINSIKIFSNHLLNLPFNEAYELEKKGSDWYTYENKEKFLKELRNHFDWKT